MSEVTKPVQEEPVVAPAAATTTTEAPVVEPVPETAPVEAVEPTTETAVTAEPAKEEVVAPKETKEVKPVEEGVLGYKGPGLLKSFIFQKKFFWFGTDAVEVKHLTSYLRGEKEAAAANHNAAWASHTGKGLLFFSKKPTDKATPAGIFNLSDVTDITEEGTLDFYFTAVGHKHTFQAASLPERDNWVAVLKTKVEDAKTQVDSVKESEEYKKSHSALTKPAIVSPLAASPKKEEIKEEKKEEKAEAKEEKKEEKKEIKEEKKEEKKARKSRSASRKRNSIFGGIGFGKKEEKVEPKEETPVATTTEEPVAPVEATPAVVEPAVVEPVIPAPAPATEEVAATEPAVKSTEPAAKPAPTKRNSIFGQLKSQFSSQHKEKKPETEGPAVPAKDAETEPVSETAPVIPQVESTEPLPTAVETPETAPVETAPVTNGETKTEAPAVKSDKRKSSLPWLTKKDKPTSDEEGEKPKSPFAKLRATVKGKSSPKAEKVEKTPETKTEETKETKPEEATPVAAPVTEQPVVSAPVSAVPATTPQVTASA